MTRTLHPGVAGPFPLALPDRLADRQQRAGQEHQCDDDFDRLVRQDPQQGRADAHRDHYVDRERRRCA